MHLAQERIVILKVFDPFGRDDRVKTAVGPGKRAIQVYLLKGRSEMHDRFGIDVRADGGEPALSKRNSQRRTAAAWRIENARAKRQAETREVLQYGALDYGDRKSTRLNSSHGYISYAVFCFKNTSNHGCHR